MTETTNEHSPANYPSPISFAHLSTHNYTLAYTTFPYHCALVNGMWQALRPEGFRCVKLMYSLLHPKTFTHIYTPIQHIHQKTFLKNVVINFFKHFKNIVWKIHFYLSFLVCMSFCLQLCSIQPNISTPKQQKTNSNIQTSPLFFDSNKIKTRK